MAHTRILRWDPDFDPSEGDMEFRLTYEGPLLAHRDDKRLEQRKRHTHDIRRRFHTQLKALWREHPILSAQAAQASRGESSFMTEHFLHDGFNWLPIVTDSNGLICKLDILMLRHGKPGKVLWDIDNKLKTIFDSLRKARGPKELGDGTIKPAPDEDPFYVLLEDDRLITHVAVTTDTLLEPVKVETSEGMVEVPEDEAARLVINVTVRPYSPYLENIGYA
jgi:hypothetical protein